MTRAEEGRLNGVMAPVGTLIGPGMDERPLVVVEVGTDAERDCKPYVLVATATVDDILRAKTRCRSDGGEYHSAYELKLFSSHAV